MNRSRDPNSRAHCRSSGGPTHSKLQIGIQKAEVMTGLRVWDLARRVTVYDDRPAARLCVCFPAALETDSTLANPRCSERFDTWMSSGVLLLLAGLQTVHHGS